MSDAFPAADRYATIPYRRVGRSGLLLPAISLGLWHNFGDGADADAARAMLRTAFDLGIVHFDLANNYGPPPGSAETRFGELFKRDFGGLRDELVIATKAGYRMWPGPYGEWGSRKYLLASLDASLKRMGLDHVDVFYSHRFDPDTPLEETMGALDSAVRAGKARYVGISSYSSAQTREAAAILRRLGTPCLIHQPRHSLLDRGNEGDRLFETLGELGVGSIVFSPLAQGMLSERYLAGAAPAGSRGAAPGFFPERYLERSTVERVRGLAGIAKRRGQTLPQMALAWTLRPGCATSALIGASSPAQVRECAGAVARLDFTAEELAEIDRFAARVGEQV
ncbi:MAG: aldo/keto reductase [Hyphomicrobiales bacterium]|nr:aldo/keto reductase [Hyphomicrobiales bacterium]MDE2017035.1 aldo/keto reductase [Hyphomicrobiales bacterium]